MPYTKLLKQLLPPKSYNPLAKNLHTSLAMEGMTLDRVFEHCRTVAGALDPFRHQEWRPLWEQVYGVPGTCFTNDMPYQERLHLLALAFQERLGGSKEWFSRIAALLGYTIDIKEHKSFKVGSFVGEQLTNNFWLYVFVIKTKGNSAKRFRASCSKSGESIAQWGNTLLECIINKYKPAHTCVYFAYVV